MQTSVAVMLLVLASVTFASTVCILTVDVMKASTSPTSTVSNETENLEHVLLNNTLSFPYSNQSIGYNLGK